MVVTGAKLSQRIWDTRAIMEYDAKNHPLVRSRGFLGKLEHAFPHFKPPHLIQ
jgi:hypothetical protein